MPYSWVYCSAEKYYSDIPSTYLKKQSDFLKCWSYGLSLLQRFFQFSSGSSQVAKVFEHDMANISNVSSTNEV